MLSRLPLVVLFFGAIVGAAVGLTTSPLIAGAGAFAMVVAGAVAATTGRHPASRGIGVVVFTSGLAALAGAFEGWHHARIAAALPSEDAVSVVEGVVIDDRVADEGRRWLVDLDGVVDDGLRNGRAVRATIAVPVFAPRLVVGRGVAVGAGDRVRLRGRLLRPGPALSPGSFDPASLARARGVHASLAIHDDADVAVVARGGAPLLVAARIALRERLLAQVPPRLAGLLLALLIGDTSLFDDEQDTAYRHVGAGHLLAVSGLQVTLLAVVLRRFAAGLLVLLPVLGRGWRAQRAAAGLALVGVWAFVGLCGMPPSAVRAAVMASAVVLGGVLGRRVLLIDALAAAGLLTVLMSPSSVQDAGFLLSYAAVLALAATGDEAPTTADGGDGSLWHRLGSAVGSFKAPVVASLTAGFATLPLSAWLFGQVAPAGLVANVVLVPVASVLQLPALLCGVVGAVVDVDVITWCGGQAALLLEAIVFGLAAILPGVRAIEPPSAILAALLVLGALGVGALVMAGRIRMAFASTTMIALGVLAMGFEPRALRVTFLPVGQGDGAVVEFPDGAVMVVDAGGRVPFDPTMSDAGRAEVLMEPGRRVVVPWLQRRGIDRVDVMVLSHPHPDHAGGLLAVARAMPVGALWLAGDVDKPGRLVRPLVAAVGATRVRSTPGLLGRHDIGGATVEVLAPAPVEGTPTYPELHANDNSLVLRICFEGSCVLLPGDLEALGEDLLIESVGTDRLRADVVKAGHHGSPTSSGQDFVRATAARHVVFCTGRHNTFGFPSPEVEARWRAAGASTWDTAVHGEMRFTLGGGDVFVRTHRRD